MSTSRLQVPISHKSQNTVAPWPDLTMKSMFLFEAHSVRLPDGDVIPCSSPSRCKFGLAVGANAHDSARSRNKLHSKQPKELAVFIGCLSLPRAEVQKFAWQENAGLTTQNSQLARSAISRVKFILRLPPVQGNDESNFPNTLIRN